MTNQTRKTLGYVFEIGKWAVVVALLWPMLTFQAERMSIWRMVLGILLLVIFIGKMFYDVIIDNYKQRKEHYTLLDLLLLVGAVTLIAIIIGGTLFLIGFYLIQQLGEANQG